MPQFVEESGQFASGSTHFVRLKVRAILLREAYLSIARMKGFPPYLPDSRQVLIQNIHGIELQCHAKLMDTVLLVSVWSLLRHTAPANIRVTALWHPIISVPGFSVRS